MKRYINILMVALATMMTSCLTEDPNSWWRLVRWRFVDEYVSA